MAIRFTLKDDLVGEELKSKLNSFGLELVYNEEDAQLLNSKEEKKEDKKLSENNFNKKKNDKIK
ncbi:MAG: hypothetical protein PHH51_04035 [Bacilli bacterium]|nr:hypothetical protein [Bacilli bacterium]MDD3896193.1 hypothetical protein [Bacilli bacterium]MDD4408178.1 hypothetical protein [Bacilli bacterium]